MPDKLTTLIISKLAAGDAADAAARPDESEQTDTARAAISRTMRVGLWTLGLGFGGFLLWAAFAPLDEGVPAPAIVSIDTKRKPVQHQTGGIVKEVLVREGGIVAAGQTLMRLDDASTQANFGAVREQFFGLRAVEGRLLAEQAGRNAIEFQPELLAAAKSDPLIARHVLNQQQLFLTRRAALAADLQAVEEGIQGNEGMLAAYKGMLASRRSHLELLAEELAQTRELVKEGYVPRNRQRELERSLADATGGVAELQGNVVRTQRTIMELRQKAIGRRADFRKEVESLLADVTRQVQADSGKYVALSNELARTEIKAPASGQVVGLAFQTAGSVISPGMKILDIVPENEQLLLDARVPPQMIDRVVAGQSVDIRFSAFAHSPALVVKGVVHSLSKDLVTDEQTRTTYYLARVGLTPEGLKELGKRQMQPGMGAEVIFKTGERSMLTYLVHPLTKRIAAAMKEE